MTGRRLRCSAPGLWDNLSRSTAGLGSSPTSILRALRPAKISECGHTRIACQNAQPATWRKKRRLRFLLRFLRFFRCFHRLDCSFNDFQFSFVQGVQHGINPLPALAPAILGRVKVLIHRYIKHCDHLIKGVEAWMLTVIFVIHNGTRSAVNNIGQLLLCHAAGFSCPLDGEPYIVKIKSSFISFNLHNITQCNFTFQVLLFERVYISCN